MKDADTMVLPRLGPGETGVEDPWDEDIAPRGGPAPGLSGSGRRRWRVAAWLVPALLMGVLGALRLGGTGRRADELPAWRAARAPWPDDWTVLYRDVDAVTPYHLLIRAWAGLVGTSEPALRVPSLLAMIAAAALVGAVAARVFTPGAGILAGTLLALLPTASRAAGEAQPYPLVLLAAVLATGALLAALDRPGRWRFVGYGGAVLVLGLSHPVALLLLAAHGWTVLALRRRVAGRWLAAAALGALPGAGLLWLAVRAGGRIGPLARPGLDALAAAPGVLFGVAALGAVLLGLALFSLPLRYPGAVFTAWAVVPPLLLLLVAQATPAWSAPVLLFTLPAWATLAAAALSRVRARWSVPVLAVIALIGAPAPLDGRTGDGPARAVGHPAEVTAGWPPEAGRPAPYPPTTAR
ncbi:glycosyltransferase family 39 protein [Micromonospora sp. NPDC050495]|uniref:glycosyltransferase family 39 protein n=1 Tax=Micromonospora sp. NPDC050495 TaxID=3154936 RepID=UPI0033DF8B6E